MINVNCRERSFLRKTQNKSLVTATSLSNYAQSQHNDGCGEQYNMELKTSIFELQCNSLEKTNAVLLLK